jgi:hypothetical protein
MDDVPLVVEVIVVALAGVVEERGVDVYSSGSGNEGTASSLETEALGACTGIGTDEIVILLLFGIIVELL